MIEEKPTHPYPQSPPAASGIPFAGQAGSNKKTSSRQYQLFAFKMLGDFGASIAVPVVLFVLIGRYLDGKYDKSPLFTILGFVLAALLTAKIIYKKAKVYGEEYKRMNNSTK